MIIKCCKITLTCRLKGFISQEIANTKNYLNTLLEPQALTDKADTTKTLHTVGRYRW